MKYLLLILLCILPATYAIQIDAVYYDAHNEAGSEFVVLSNPTNSIVDISGWSIATPASANDANLVGVILPQSEYLLTDANWNNGKDNSTWPESDHQETLTLSNSDGYVQLIDTFGTVHDTIGYGGSEIATGNPHPGTQEGYALIRVSDTGDNAQDFIEAIPFQDTPAPEGNQSNIPIEAAVENSAPELLSVFIDGTLVDQEATVYPQNEHLIEVLISDNNTLRTLTVLVNGEEINTNSTQTSALASANISITQNTQTLHIQVSDEVHTVERTIQLNWQEAVGLTITSNLSLSLTPGQTISRELALRNVGSVPLNLHIQGSTPSLLDTILGEVRYNIGGENYLLSDDFRIHPLSLSQQQELLMEVDITAGYVPAGTYTGQIIIVGVPA